MLFRVTVIGAIHISRSPRLIRPLSAIASSLSITMTKGKKVASSAGAANKPINSVWNRNKSTNPAGDPNKPTNLTGTANKTTNSAGNANKPTDSVWNRNKSTNPADNANKQTNPAGTANKFSGPADNANKSTNPAGTADKPSNPAAATNKSTDPAVTPNKSSNPAGDFKPTDLNFGYGERKPINESEFKKFMEKIHKMRDFYAPSIKNYNINEKRIKCINGPTFPNKGAFRGVCFWMFRDQRLDDNWALIYAQKLALENKCPLYVTFFLMSHYSVAGIRQYDFMLRGLQELEKRCAELGIQFHLRLGYAKDIIDTYCEEYDIDCVVADFMPLRDPTSWVDEAGKKLRRKGIRLYQVDAHNIVPVWVPCDKMAFGATSIRPKIQFHMREFLTEFPNIEKHPYPPRKKSEPADWNKAWSHLNVDESVKPITWAQPGCTAGYKMLFEFITQRLDRFVADRNTPTKHAQSCMSPYYHFGNISVQRAILLVSQDIYKERCPESVESYIEEAVIRRELADNFTYYQPDYDNFNGAFDWAKKSLNRHRSDKREYTYSQEELQFAKTHDKAWNAAQIQMLREGTMHQYMRMYWAKKILEWSPSPEEALRIAILFNDKYQMDGRDPNGYAGCMWSIVGMHDRTFNERPVVGHIRYMTYGGCARKFDVHFYAKTYSTVP